MGFLSQLLKAVSGNNNLKVSEQLLFNKVIGFKGVVPGCGTSTIVQNVAIALSEKTSFSICVLDTNFLYPVQYPMLVSDESKRKSKDILDFSTNTSDKKDSNGDVSEIAVPTTYNNVHLVHLSNRNVIDMLSGKDTEVVISKVISSLKSFFDIVLIDISNEFTNISVHSAIKCNKLYLIADSSLKCLYHLNKSLNTMVTLAVPLAKANKVILNKQLPDALLGVNGIMEKAGLQVEGEIPLSVEIAKNGAAGKKIYGMISKNKEITTFNAVIEKILSGIVEKTPLNEGYFNVDKALEIMEKDRQLLENQGDKIIETIDDSYDIVEINNGVETEIGGE